MHHPTDRIAHTTAFLRPVVEHWVEREIAQWEIQEMHTSHIAIILRIEVRCVTRVSIAICCNLNTRPEISDAHIRPTMLYSIELKKSRIPTLFLWAFVVVVCCLFVVCLLLFCLLFVVVGWLVLFVCFLFVLDS